MKRGGPIQRRTPLAKGKQLQRKPPPAFTGPWPSRSKPIKPKRDTPRRRNRRDPEHGISWTDVRLVIYVRSGGRCEGCAVQLNIANMEAHHRRTRRVGPDCPCNALALCHDCHHHETHGRPTLARSLGRIIRREDPTPPAEIPVELHDGRVVRLDCGGTYSDAA